MKPLTAEEIAELRASLQAGLKATPNTALRAEDAFRLLDEVERLREVFRIATSDACAMGTMVATAEVLKAADFAERSRALLKRIENKGGTYRELAACPECFALEDFDTEQITHKPGCELAALLG